MRNQSMRDRNLPTSGRGAAWKRACFGSRKSEVQILSPRPVFTWSEAESEGCRALQKDNQLLDNFIVLHKETFPDYRSAKGAYSTGHPGYSSGITRFAWLQKLLHKYFSCLRRYLKKREQGLSDPWTWRRQISRR